MIRILTQNQSSVISHFGVRWLAAAFGIAVEPGNYA